MPGAGRRTVVRLLAVTMAASTVLGVESVPGAAERAERAEPVGWLAGLTASTPADDPVAAAPQPARSAPLERSKPAEPVTVSFPRPGTEEVTLRPGRSLDAAGGAVAITSGAGARLRLEVLDRKLSTRAGISGFAFRMPKWTN